MNTAEGFHGWLVIRVQLYTSLYSFTVGLEQDVFVQLSKHRLQTSVDSLNTVGLSLAFQLILMSY